MNDTENNIKTLAIAGCGKLGSIVAKAAADGFLNGYKLIGVYSRSATKAQAVASAMAEAGQECHVASTIESLLAMHPDFLVEAAAPQALREWLLPALTQGTSVVCLSIGAFADDSFYAEAVRTAKSNGSRIYIVSGATGGFDVLQTATLMGGAKAEFFNEKGPEALHGTPVYDETLQTESRTVFSGSATEAIALFPTKVNVTVAAARASVGPTALKVRIQSTPGFKGDTQHVEISNSQVHAVIDVYSKTAEIAAWSVVSTLRNIISPIVFV